MIELIGISWSLTAERFLGRGDEAGQRVVFITLGSWLAEGLRNGLELRGA